MHSSRSGRVLPLLVAALFALPVPVAPQSPKAIVTARNRVFAEGFAKKNTSVIASLYLDSARVSRSGPQGFDSVRTRQGIEEFWQGVIGIGVVSFEVTTVEATLAKDTITETGSYVMKLGDGKVRSQGTYRTIWRKAGAVWLIQDNAWTEAATRP